MGVKVAFLGTAADSEAPPEVQGVLIAGESIRSDAEGDFVWLVRDDIVEKRRISVGGPRERPQVLVVRGLASGDTVVRSSAAPLAAGQAIRTNN
jgi:hypothetical protein